jgi:hypothetical protein
MANGNSIGGAEGSAIALRFPEVDVVHPSLRGGRTQAGSQQGDFDARLDDQIGKDVPVQLDDAGMTSAYHKSVQAIRQFALENLSRGIDVTAAPDPRNPQSYEAIELWHQALAQHAENRERLSQGKQNLDILGKGLLSGELQETNNFASGNFGAVKAQDLHKLAFASAPKFIRDVNNILDTVPRTQEEHAEFEQFRNQQIAEIRQKYQDGRYSEEERDHLISLIQPVRDFDSASFQNEQDLQRARINAQKAAAGASRARAAASRASKTKTELETPDLDPRIQTVASLFMEPRKVGAGPVRPGDSPPIDPFENITGGPLEGSSLAGANQFFFEDASRLSNGNIRFTFSKDKTSEATFKAEDFDGEVFAGVSTEVVKGGKSVEVEIPKDNITPIIFTLMDKKAAAEQVKVARSQGLIGKDGRLNAEKVFKTGSADDPFGLRSFFQE